MGCYPHLSRRLPKGPAFRFQHSALDTHCQAVNQEKQNIGVNLTKKQIEESPSLDTDKPVSHQFEQAYYRHYDYPTYWGGPYSWGAFPYFVRDREARDHGQKKIATPGVKGWDPHLRSTYSVSGHHIQTVDGELGHIEDFIIDDDTWAIRYLIVDTHNWWPGKKVLVAPQWIERVSWGERKVFVNLDRETIKQSAQSHFDPKRPLIHLRQWPGCDPPRP